MPGLAPGSVRAQTAQGGWEFMKTAEYVAFFTGWKSVSLRNLKEGLGPSELVLTCGCSPSLLASYQALCFPEPVFISNPTNCTIMYGPDKMRNIMLSIQSPVEALFTFFKAESIFFSLAEILG